MNIEKATYGNVDVTDKIKLYFQNNSYVKASNEIFGDTHVGVFKYLKIYLSDKSEISIPEGETFYLEDYKNFGKTIGIAVVCTNAYFILGIRFIKRFMHFYIGKNRIKFFIFTDTSPDQYLEGIDFKYINTKHNNWNEGTNSKFENILKLEDEDCDYLYYFDADTNIKNSFTESWFLGDLVGGEHYGNNTWMKENKPFDRNEKSKAYVPINTNLPQMYFYGAFFGGLKDNMISFCRILKSNQDEDKKINYEPCWNDESYINQFFHYNPPNVIKTSDFKFVISDKGGIGETRSLKTDIQKYKDQILKNNSQVFDIINGKIIFI